MRATGVAKTTTPAVRLQPTSTAEIEWEGQQLQTEIARRAYELFELRGGEHGQDWEDWFRAESELLRPMSVAISESDQRVSVRINVPGFEANELKVAIEPLRATILARRQGIAAGSEYADRAFRVIELPKQVNPDAAAVGFEAGVIKLELFKLAKSTVPTGRQSA